jgi:hypothetical protein
VLVEVVLEGRRRARGCALAGRKLADALDVDGDGGEDVLDRAAADKPFYSGKHKRHGMNLQVISSPGGEIRWVSGPLPGSVHDKRAERIWGVLDELEAAGLIVLADKGYQGAAHAKLRAPGERANAQLKNGSRTGGSSANSGVSVLNRGAGIDGRVWPGSGGCMPLRPVRAVPSIL